MAKPSSLADLKNPAKFEQVEITVQHEEEEPLNIELQNVAQEVIMVSKVSTNSLLEGSVQPGDYIITVNGKSFKTKENLFYFALKQDPTLKIAIARPKFQTPPKQTPQKTTGRSPSSSSVPVPTPAPAPTPTVEPVPTLTSSQPPSTVKPPPICLTSTATISPETRIFAAFQASALKADKEYYVMQIKSSKSRKLGLGIRYAPHDKSIIIVSSVEPNSVSSEAFKPGDRFLVINLTKVSDIETCRKLIVDSGGNFDVFIERPSNGLLEYGIVPPAPVLVLPPQEVVPLKSSYAPPNVSDPDEVLGNPLINYETAPADVQTILNRQIPILIPLMATVGDSTRRDMSLMKKPDQLKIDQDITEHNIGSDIHPERQLRKPPR